MPVRCSALPMAKIEVAAGQKGGWLAGNFGNLSKIRKKLRRSTQSDRHLMLEMLRRCFSYHSKVVSLHRRWWFDVGQDGKMPPPKAYISYLVERYESKPETPLISIDMCHNTCNYKARPYVGSMVSPCFSIPTRPWFAVQPGAYKS